MYEFKQIRDIAKFALRTAEDSSVVGLIDSTPAKQPEDSANTDGDLDSVIDDNPLQVELDREKRKNEDLYRDFKGANDLYLAENLRAEKFQDALLRIRHLLWKDLSQHGKEGLYALLLHVFSIAYKALKVEDPYDKAAAEQLKNDVEADGDVDGEALFCGETGGCEKCSHKTMNGGATYCDLHEIHIYKFEDNSPGQEVQS